MDIKDGQLTKQEVDSIDACGCSIEGVNVVSDTKIFRVKTEHKIKFKSGQFFLLSDKDFLIDEKIVQRAYSICSSEDEDRHLEFAITMLSNGTFSRHVSNFKDGHKLCIKGPYGKFFLDKTKNSTFIAGGSGVTPFISMLRTIRDQKLNDKMKATLIYSLKTLSDVLFIDELKEINKLPNVDIILCITRETGVVSNDFTVYGKRIDDEIIKKHLLTDSQVYTCGPKEMIIALHETLSKFIPVESVHNERWMANK
ncbi:MAG: FAD-dependent oxidoreductase [Candidatus Woesearchaeota archaeon]|jgi:ferredoxin-NADP reductase